MVYASRATRLDDEQKIQTGHQRCDACILLYQGNRIPIYGDTITFPQAESGLLADEDSEEPVAYQSRSEEGVICRIGYDLFGEVRRLLTIGQPAANASIPTLELHIALLRDLIVAAGSSLVEVPPVPDGYNALFA